MAQVDAPTRTPWLDKPGQIVDTLEHAEAEALRYRPKPKSEPAKKRRRRSKKLEKARV